MYKEYAKQFLKRHKEYNGWNGSIPDEVAGEAVEFLNRHNLWHDNVAGVYDELGINALICDKSDSEMVGMNEECLDFETENYAVYYWFKRP